MTLTPLTKKLIGAAAVILVAIGFAVAMYFVFFGGTADDGGNANLTNEELTNGGLLPSTNTNLINGTTELPLVNGSITPDFLPAVPRVAQGGVTLTERVTDTDTRGAVTGAGGGTLKYYDRTTGAFYEITANGERRALSDQTFFQVEGVKWSPNQNSALLTFPDGRTIYYDFQQQQQASIPEGAREFSFSGSGDQITFKYTSGGEDFLVVANPDGSNVTALYDLGANADRVQANWSPSNDVVGVELETRNRDQQEVFPLGAEGENLKSFVVDGFGFESLWAPTGARMLYSVYSASTGYRPALWVVDAQGESIGSNQAPLGVQTWAQKCTFATDTALYCAVPDSLPESSGIYPELAAGTSDRVVFIDLVSGSTRSVAVPLTDAGSTMSVSSLHLAEGGRVLYITDQGTGRIYKLQLQ